MIDDLLRSIRHHLRWVIGVPAVTGALVVFAGLMQDRKYEAPLVVSPVSSRPSIGGMGLAASVLGASAMQGLQSTPTLVARLARLDGVLLGVAHSPVDTGPLRVIDRLRDEAAGAVNDRDALAELRRVVSATADLQTGLVTIRVTSTDSTMVRVVAERLLAATSDAFMRASRAQATALKNSQAGRVDSASSRLAAAEEAVRRFRSANRSVSELSTASLTEARLTRELTLAEELYGRATEDRESAASRELEETPALVVVDGVPDTLLPRSRGLLMRAVLWASLALAVVILVPQMRAVATVRPS